MELSYTDKQALLARLAARQPRPYDPERDITIEDMIQQLTTQMEHPSRNIANKLLKEAVTRGELCEETAIRRGKQIRVYRPVVS